MIDLEQALRTLKEQGCGPNDTGAFTCPRCRAAALTIVNNGAGPDYHCADGCEHIAACLETIASIKAPQGEHIDTLEVLRGKLKLPELQRVVKHGRLGSSYDLILDNGTVVTLGGIANITSQAKFRAAFIPQVRRGPPRYKPGADWDQIAVLIEQNAEERDSVISTDDETLGWIAGALASSHPARNISMDNAQQLYDLLAPGHNGRPPFYDIEGRLHLRLDHLTLWLGRMSGIRVTGPELSTRLSGLDFENVQHQARSGEKTRRARYWVSPAGIEDRL